MPVTLTIGISVAQLRRFNGTKLAVNTFNAKLPANHLFSPLVACLLSWQNRLTNKFYHIYILYIGTYMPSFFMEWAYKHFYICVYVYSRIPQYENIRVIIMNIGLFIGKEQIFDISNPIWGLHSTS